jgi:hypothetical protein
MKKLIAVLFLAFVMMFVSEIYSQPKQKKVDVYFGKNDGKYVMLDENYTFIDSNYVWTGRIESIESLVKKYIGKNRDNDYFFTEKEKWQKDFTGIKLGEEFYISTPSAILKGDVSAYKLWNNEPMGYEFSPVLKMQTKINEDTVEYNNNIFICSKYKEMSTINNKPIEDAEVIKKVTAFLDEYTKNIIIDPEMGVDEPAEIKVFQANFLNTDRNEYAVSYRKRIGFDKFASGIYIINDIGKIAKTVVEFASEFNYYCLVGVVDYNGDGQYELFGESGYYEGNGYDLYKINSEGNFELIASGFYWGV